MKNNIILSCGHSINSIEKSHSVMIKAQDRHGNKALKFSSLCSLCRNRYFKNDELFDDENEAILWLTSVNN